MNRSQSRQRNSFPFSYRTRKHLGNQVIAAVSGAMSRVFHTIRTRAIIVGVNPATRLLANELYGIGNQVSIVNLKIEAGPDPETIPFVSTAHPATADETLLAQAGAQTARCFLAALAEDDRNLSLCRTAIDQFRIPVVIARLRLMDGVTTWVRVNDAGMSRMSWNDMIQALVPDVSLTPALLRIARADDREQIAEIEVRLPILVGRVIGDFSLKNCEIVALTRRGAPISTNPDRTLEMNDMLTLIGVKADLEKVRESFASL